MTRPARRVLVISYFFPPRPAAAGLRPRALVRYLPDHGWEPVVLAAEYGGARAPAAEGRVVWTKDPGEASALLKTRLGMNPRRSVQEQVGVPAALSKAKRPWIRKLFMHVKGYVIFPDDLVGWRPLALSAAQRLLRSERFDAVLTSSPPSAAHIVGRSLKSAHGFPWVADFRDLWSQNHLYEYGAVRRWFERRFEVATLASADALVTVSEPLAARLREIHGDRPTLAIPNGFDPGDYPTATGELTHELTITHAGSLYQGRTDPAPLLRVAGDLIARGALDRRTLRIRFFGDPEPWLDREIAEHGLSDVARQHGRIDRSEVLRREVESHVLLQLVWSDPREPGVYSAKLFEYLGARRPILAVGGPERSVVREALERTRAGDYCSSDEQVRETLLRYAREHAETGRVAYHGLGDEIATFDHPEMARRFAEVLDRVARRRTLATAGRTRPPDRG